jgi:Redoxin
MLLCNLGCTAERRCHVRALAAVSLTSGKHGDGEPLWLQFSYRQTLCIALLRSMEHLPSYIRRREDFAARGVDEVACVSVNDAFVMDAWRASLGADSILMLADGNAQFATAMAAELDLSARNVGTRSRRYSMLVEDGKARTSLSATRLYSTCLLLMPLNLLAKTL